MSEAPGTTTGATDGRSVILERVRSALGDTPRPHARIDRDYLPADPGNDDDNVSALSERLSHYDAHVARVDPDSVSATVARLFGERGFSSIVVPPGLDPQWLPSGDDIEWLHDSTESPLDRATIGNADAVITAATVAAADTGTIVLDGSAGQGRRTLSLLPDAMLVILDLDQIVANLPAAIARLDPRHPLTFISGPSATVDIELVRVEGVHGPRVLDVIISG